MVAGKPMQKGSLVVLENFLKLNSKIELRDINLFDVEVLSSFQWKGVEKEKEKIINALKAYQRLMRILPDEDHEVIMKLLGENIHSALQITAIPKPEFMQRYASAFSDDQELVTKAYNKALAIRSNILIRYMDVVQSAAAPANSPSFKK